MSWMNNLRIKQKTFGGFGAVMALLVLMGVGGIFALMNVADIFSGYRAQARQSNAVAAVIPPIYEARMGVKNFLITGDFDVAEQVKASEKAAIASGQRALDFIDDPEKRDRMASKFELLETYEATFDEVVELQRQRDDVIGNTLDTLGSQIRQNVTQIMKSAYYNGDPKAAYYGGLTQQHLMLARLYVQRFLITNRAEDFERAGQELDEMARWAGTLIDNLQNERRLELANAVMADAKVYREGVAKVHDLIMARNDKVTNTLDVIGPDVVAEAQAMMQQARARQDELGPQAVRQIQGAEWALGIAAVVAVVLGAVLAWLIGTGIANPITAMTGAMRKLADGDKGVEIPATGQKDEVGDMADAVQVFKDNMIEADRLAAEQKQAQEKQLARAKRLEELAANFDQTVASVLTGVSGATDQMSSSAQSMSSIAEQTRGQATTASGASSQASSNVQTVASAAEELSSSIQEIARQVQTSTEISNRAVTQAGSTQETVQELAKAADRIGEVVQLISEIAEQTNLLALNATIEAARAGEAGKGFAVVAEEVKTLANQTAKATEEIGQQISGIQGVTGGAVKAIEDIASTVEELNTIASSISAAVEEQSAATGEISRSVQEASKGTEQVSGTLRGVNDGADETSRAAEQVVTAVSELSTQTNTLKVEVDSFLTNIKAA